MKDIAFGKYYPGDSVLHKMDARFKFVLTIFMMVGLFLLSGLVPFLLFALFILIMVFISKIPFKQLLLSLKPILFIIIFAFVINIFSFQGEPLFQVWKLTITYEGLFAGFKMAARLTLLIFTSTVFLTLTTTPLDVADAMESLMRPLQKIGFPAHEISMMMSIALRFVPNLIEETDKIMKAQSSRGARYDTGGAITRARGLVSILVPLFVSCFRRAEDLALAMEARCYNGAEGRTRLRLMKASGVDYFMTVLILLVMGLILFLEFSKILSLSSFLPAA